MISSTAIQRFKDFNCTVSPCARSHRSTSQTPSLLSPATLSLSHPISTFRPSPASAPPQKGFYPAIKKKLGGFHRFLRLIWPEKGRDFRRPPKLQTDDSSSTAINGRRDHRNQNPRHQIYQDRPFVGQKSRQKISPPPTVAAREPHAPHASTRLFVFEKDRCQKCKYQIWIMSIIFFGNPDVILLLGLKRQFLDESPNF
jgi:hypothetical protein